MTNAMFWSDQRRSRSLQARRRRGMLLSLRSLTTFNDLYFYNLEVAPGRYSYNTSSRWRNGESGKETPRAWILSRHSEQRSNSTPRVNSGDGHLHVYLHFPFERNRRLEVHLLATDPWHQPNSLRSAVTGPTSTDETQRSPEKSIPPTTARTRRGPKIIFCADHRPSAGLAYPILVVNCSDSDGAEVTYHPLYVSKQSIVATYCMYIWTSGKMTSRASEVSYRALHVPAGWHKLVSQDQGFAAEVHLGCGAPEWRERVNIAFEQIHDQRHKRLRIVIVLP